MLNQRARDQIIGGLFIAAVFVLLSPMLFDQNALPVGSVTDIDTTEIVVGEQSKSTPQSLTEIESTRTRLSGLLDNEGYWVDSETLIGQPILGESAEAHGAKPAWAIQVASFIEERNALSLRDELVVLELPAWLVHVRKDGRKVTRVGVGPMVSLESAKIMKERLVEDYPESIIVSFKL